MKPRIADIESEIARCAKDTEGDDPEFQCGHCAQLVPLIRLARAVKAQRAADPEWHHCDLDEFNAALDETNAAIDAIDWDETQ